MSLLVALPAGAADVISRIEDAYAVRQLRRTPFDPGAALSLDRLESYFIEDLLELTDEGALLNVNVLRWFVTSGAQGTHALSYLERSDSLRNRIDEIETPERMEPVRKLVVESLVLQRGFVADWNDALEQGRPFASQLTDEFAYHEGLHRSHRLLLKTYAELHALFPDADERTRMAFGDHLRALDLK